MGQQIIDLAENATPPITTTWIELHRVGATESERMSLDQARSLFADNDPIGKTYGYIYATGTETLTSLDTGTYKSPSANLVLDLASHITYTAGSITYTGTPDIHVKVFANLTVDCSADADFHFYWVKNWSSGAPTGRDLNSKVTNYLKAGDPQHVSAMWWMSLSTNDTIDLVVNASTTSNLDLIQSKYLIQGISLDTP